MRNMIVYISKDLENYMIYDNELLTENTEWISKRLTLNNSIKTYKNHKTFFENL